MFFGRKPRKTLVVHCEDEPDIREMVAAALEPMGMQVLSAPDGPSGLQLILKERPDLVLLDVRMPGMDGFTVCQALRDHPNHKDTPIFMLTAMSQVKDIERGANAGATGYIIKPIDVAKLRHKVIEILGDPGSKR